MAVEKMKLINIAGPIEAIDKFSLDHIVDSEINLENTLTALGNIGKLYPYSDYNDCEAVYKKINEFSELMGEKANAKTDGDILSKDEIFKFMDSVNATVSSALEKRSALEEKINENEDILSQLEPMVSLDLDLNKLLEFEFIKFRYGRIPQRGFMNLETYLNDIDAFFIQTKSDSEHVWGMYFAPEPHEEKIDAIFDSLYFERVFFTNRISGTAKETYDDIKKETEALKEEAQSITNGIRETLISKADKFSEVRYSLSKYDKLYTVKKYAAHTKDSFYIVGWMTERNIKKVQSDLKDNEDIIILVEAPEDVNYIKPPTKLRNFFLFKPFEMFVKMYGLPSYNEIDPTPLLAITYTIMFGIMFGDVGQGAILAVLGFVYYKWKKSNLGGIMSIAGVSSVIFGFLYGSIFGNEHILHGVIVPMDNINFMLLGGVSIGVVLISVSIIINIINAVKSKDTGRLLFTHNSFAGIILYWTMIFSVIYTIMNTGKSISVIIVAILIGVPILSIFFAEPLKALVKKRRDWMPKNKGMFFLESFFELFEIMLSFITNTVSFVRVGAFALTHAGMMGVVFLLADMAGGSIVVHIIGNVIVIALETLIVGIQILRLEYYEMFGRFLEADGREFKTISSKNLK